MAKRKKKGNNVFKYIICFILFLGLGGAVGYFGTKKYLESKKDEEDVPAVVPTEVDITKDEDYQELIKELHGYLNANPIFYSTKGLKIADLSNDEKLKLIYSYMVSMKQDVPATLASSGYLWPPVCPLSDGVSSFVVDASNGVYSNICTVTTLSGQLLQEDFSKLYGDVAIDFTQSFKLSDNRACIFVNSNYTCGYINYNAVPTGDLEVRFAVEKVLKYDDKIVLYDRGYLIDTRSNMINLNDGNPNHYLHSSDSTDYYFELKSSDNITFKHTFALDEEQNYHYVSSEVAK